MANRTHGAGREQAAGKDIKNGIILNNRLPILWRAVKFISR